MSLDNFPWPHPSDHRTLGFRPGGEMLSPCVGEVGMDYVCFDLAGPAPHMGLRLRGHRALHSRRALNPHTFRADVAALLTVIRCDHQYRATELRAHLAALNAAPVPRTAYIKDPHGPQEITLGPLTLVPRRVPSVAVRVWLFGEDLPGIGRAVVPFTDATWVDVANGIVIPAAEHLRTLIEAQDKAAEEALALIYRWSL